MTFFFLDTAMLEKVGVSAEKDFVLGLTEYHAVFFDGKTDTTVHNDNGRRSLLKEEQFAIVGYPCHDYLGYVVPEIGQGKSIASSVFEHLTKMNFKYDSLLAIGGDGCSTNTDPWNGAFHWFEEVNGLSLL